MADDLAVSVATSPDRQDLVFYSVLADLTRGRTVATLMTALSPNLHQEATRGGALALDPGSQTLVFSLRMPVGSTPVTDWMIALENFCETAEGVRSSLEDAIGEFSDAELREMDQRAAAEPGLSESGDACRLQARCFVLPQSHQRLTVPSQLDNTLASNVATGLFLPRPDQAIGHGVKYLLQQLKATAADALAHLGRRSPAPDLSPRAIQQPGNAVPMTAVSGNSSSRGRMETLTCGETGRTHPVLPGDLRRRRHPLPSGIPVPLCVEFCRLAHVCCPSAAGIQMSPSTACALIA